MLELDARPVPCPEGRGSSKKSSPSGKVYDYEAPDGRHVKAKGFGRLSAAEFERVAAGDVVYRQGFTRLRGMLRGIGKGTMSGPENTSLSKSLIGKTRPKRCALADGDSRAWTVRELER